MSYILREVVLSYPNLFVPKIPPNARPGQKARYSAMILIPQSVDISDLQKVVYNLMKDRWGDKTDELLQAGMANQPNGLRWPFRKDNLKRDGTKRYDEATYKCFITPWSETQPGLVDCYVGTDGKPLKITQPDQTKLYAGCVVNVSVNPFVYDNTGNRGVNFGLVNMQHWGDGERLDNRVAAEDQFQGRERPTSSITDDDAPFDGSAPVGGPAAGPGSKGSMLGNLIG